MKKVFLTSIVMMFAAILSAATPTSWGNVVTVKLTDGNNDTYTSRFGTSPELTDAASWGAAVANFEGATVKAYVVLNGENYEKLYLNDMVNVPLMVKTYEHATLTFNLKANYGTISLYDNLTKTVTTVEKGSASETLDYECTVPTNTTVTDRFFLFYNAASFNYAVTLNAYGWATFSCAEDVVLDQPAGLKIYKGALSGDVLNLTEVDDIPANTGVVLNGTPGETYYLVPTTATADMSGNNLKPTSAYTIGDQNVFVLQGDALYQYVGTTALAAKKAYLQLPGSPSSAPRRISFRFDHATGVQNVEATAVKAEKFMEDGQVLIKRGENVYNLQGQIVK